MTAPNPLCQHIIGKCLADASFKQQFIANPAAMLRAEGFTLPNGIKVNVVENTATEITFVIPAPLSDVPDEALARVAGGAFNQNTFTINTL
jgi:hypothetical protein